jgi:hypothetical protein
MDRADRFLGDYSMARLQRLSLEFKRQVVLDFLAKWLGLRELHESIIYRAIFSASG